jgi:hypothetical protein
MNIKINYNKLREISKKVFDMYYGDIDSISDYNLDKHLIFKSKDTIRLQLMTTGYGKYLYFYSDDMESIRSILPVSVYMFKKLITEWFENKYEIPLVGPIMISRMRTVTI